MCAVCVVRVLCICGTKPRYTGASVGHVADVSVRECVCMPVCLIGGCTHVLFIHAVMHVNSILSAGNIPSSVISSLSTTPTSSSEPSASILQSTAMDRVTSVAPAHTGSECVCVHVHGCVHMCAHVCVLSGC